MNIESSLSSAARTGKVSFGSNSALHNIRDGKGKMVIISQNCSLNMYNRIRSYSEITNVPVLVFKGSSNDLGSICRKPFPVSAMTIFEEGDSDILNILK